MDVDTSQTPIHHANGCVRQNPLRPSGVQEARRHPGDAKQLACVGQTPAAPEAADITGRNAQ